MADVIIGVGGGHPVKMTTIGTEIAFVSESATAIAAVLAMVASKAMRIGFWTCEEGMPVRLTAHGEDLADAWRKASPQ